MKSRGKKPAFHDVRHLTSGGDKDAIKAYKQDLKARGGDWRKGFRKLKRRYKKGDETATDEFILSEYTNTQDKSGVAHEGQVSGRDYLPSEPKSSTSSDIATEDDDND